MLFSSSHRIRGNKVASFVEGNSFSAMTKPALKEGNSSGEKLALTQVKATKQAARTFRKARKIRCPEDVARQELQRGRSKVPFFFFCKNRPLNFGCATGPASSCRGRTAGSE